MYFIDLNGLIQDLNLSEIYINYNSKNMYDNSHVFKDTNYIYYKPSTTKILWF